MKIAELRQLVLKSQNGLQKPKYIILSDTDYSELKTELEELQEFLGHKGVFSKFTLGGMNIISEGEMVDLRQLKEICYHPNTHLTASPPIISPTEGYCYVNMTTWCSTCGTQIV